MERITPILMLPNVNVIEPIESTSGLIVSSSDKRLRLLSREHPNFRIFLSRFKNAFGHKVTPSIFALKASADDVLRNTDAIASFRDALAMSVIPYQRALLIQRPNGPYIVWTDYFNFYPWMLDKNNEYLIGNSPAMLGLDEAREFHGQCSPELFPQSLRPHELDNPLLAALLERWEKYFAQRAETWENRALFRSLNMAFRAGQMPAGKDLTIYDVGRAVALWVSAFEILSHPGGTQKTDYGRVSNLIRLAPWKSAKTIETKYAAYKMSGQTTVGRWLYGELYRTRNSFLHGNPVGRSDLLIPASGRNLFEFAAPLFRMALASFLALEEPAWKIETLKGEAQKREIERQFRFVMPQHEIEKSLLLAQQPKPNPR